VISSEGSHWQIGDLMKVAPQEAWFMVYDALFMFNNSWIDLLEQTRLQTATI